MINFMQRSASVAVLIVGISLTPSAFGQAINAKVVIHLPNGSAPSFSASGPAGMTVEQLMQRAQLNYTATFFPSVGGYALMQIQGVPPQTNGDFGSPFWWLCVNEISAQAGMSAQAVNNGDEVEWYFVTDGKCPRDPVQQPHR